jgi:soluble lytic murein transglycosylase-like protein
MNQGAATTVARADDERKSMTRFGTAGFLCAIALAAALAPARALAGAQVEEHLAPSVVAGLQRAIADHPAPAHYAAQPPTRAWIDSVSARLIAKIPDYREREDFLATVHYEATRAGLDPQLVLGVIHHESGFRKYAMSVASARGYMQVMPFWTKLIGASEHNLFNLRTNLRYGCVILRHYLDVENGDLYRALGRYNGSLGRPEYPNAVLAAMLRWQPPAASPSPSPAVRAALPTTR